jgi:hypothetical protein
MAHKGGHIIAIFPSKRSHWPSTVAGNRIQPKKEGVQMVVELTNAFDY